MSAGRVAVLRTANAQLRRRPLLLVLQRCRPLSASGRRTFGSCRVWHGEARRPAPSDGAGGSNGQLPCPGEGIEDERVREIFRCDGIEPNAVTMRRRVQFAMGSEFAAAQVANLYFLRGTMEYTATTLFIENSNAFLAMHIYAVWKYAAFLRDALLARHVTNVSVVVPSPGMDALLAARGAPALGSSPGDEPLRFEVASSIEPIVVLVQTGPWLRRLRLVAGADGGASSANERVSFGQMLGSGLLHLDREMGEVVDERSLEALLHAPLFVEAEDVTTDVDAAKRAYIGDDRLAMFLSEGVDAEQTQGLNKHPVARRVLRINGGRFLDGFGWLALAMGLGSVVLWCKPRN